MDIFLFAIISCSDANPIDVAHEETAQTENESRLWLALSSFC